MYRRKNEKYEKEQHNLVSLKIELSSNHRKVPKPKTGTTKAKRQGKNES